MAKSKVGNGRIHELERRHPDDLLPFFVDQANIQETAVSDMVGRVGKAGGAHIAEIGVQRRPGGEEEVLLGVLAGLAGHWR